MEIWKVIPGFEHYEASDMGRVRSTNFKVVRRNGRVYTHKGVVLAQMKNGDGYSVVELYINKKRFLKPVHRLVYEAFNGSTRKELIIDHINNIRTDNRLENLQLITNRRNLQKDSWRHKKSGLPIGVYRQGTARMYASAICINNIQYFIGSFKTIKEAKEAYMEADKKYQENGEIPSGLHRVRHKVIDGCKVCSMCGENKPLSEYYISRGRVQGKCKECFKEERKRLYNKTTPS